MYNLNLINLLYQAPVRRGLRVLAPPADAQKMETKIYLNFNFIGRTILNDK